ncbi:hypothetical protein C4A77_18915 [Brevibacillus laterosporus]|uniref:Uncharacterized protein n=1 Tax=Brevibacillus laterosporus TaxID=1465 RepID=A0AAP8QBA4_BRELA|nr:hypothetical protein C4A77_18915 [Brevibacillus laterosporus]
MLYSMAQHKYQAQILDLAQVTKLTVGKLSQLLQQAIFLPYATLMGVLQYKIVYQVQVLQL